MDGSWADLSLFSSCKDSAAGLMVAWSSVGAGIRMPPRGWYRARQGVAWSSLPGRTS
jgi:hypothetical protein